VPLRSRQALWRRAREARAARAARAAHATRAVHAVHAKRAVAPRRRGAVGVARGGPAGDSCSRRIAAAAATQPPRLAAQPQSRSATTGRPLPERAGRARRPAVACRWRAAARWRATLAPGGHRFLQLLVVLPPRGGRRVVVAVPTARRVHAARRCPRSLEASAVLPSVATGLVHEQPRRQEGAFAPAAAQQRHILRRQLIALGRTRSGDAAVRLGRGWPNFRRRGGGRGGEAPLVSWAQLRRRSS